MAMEMPIMFVLKSSLNIWVSAILWAVMLTTPNGCFLAGLEN
jgi:hypothetical protein